MRRISILLLAAVLGVGVQSSYAASPPWWQVAREIQTVLSTDRFASVTLIDESSTSNEVIVQVNVAQCTPGRTQQGRKMAAGGPCADASLEKAAALATLLSASATTQTANFFVKTVVRLLRSGAAVQPGEVPADAVAAAAMLQSAMLGNSLFHSIQTIGPSAAAKPLAVFKPSVMQYYSDDISQVGGFTSKVAAEIMNSAFGLQDCGVFVSTAPCNGQDCPMPST